MQQVYRRTPMPKCDFNKVAKQNIFIEILLRHGCSPVTLLHIFRTPFPKNTSGGLLLLILREKKLVFMAEFWKKFRPFFNKVEWWCHDLAVLTYYAPTLQNGQTHSNNSSAKVDELFECVWLFCGLALKGLS